MHNATLPERWGTSYGDDAILIPSQEHARYMNQLNLADKLDMDIAIYPLISDEWLVPALFLWISKVKVGSYVLENMPVFPGTFDDMVRYAEAFEKECAEMHKYAPHPISNAFEIRANGDIIGGGFSPYLRGDAGDAVNLSMCFCRVVRLLNPDFFSLYQLAHLDPKDSIYAVDKSATYLFLKKKRLKKRFA